MFDSDVEDFFLAHFAMSGASTEVARARGPTGLPTGLDITTRITTSPVISIAKIRGRLRQPSRARRRTRRVRRRPREAHRVVRPAAHRRGQDPRQPDDPEQPGDLENRFGYHLGVRPEEAERA
ncbi:hypothetical protein ACQPXB_08925 [Amycolatopsis sp. CA-161197]|uniref:hypothetical protein n=1 Tax=Amycolatopsis sp. CA-161197 TaxID=3239922 RepID=UPI003D8A44FC